MVKGLESGFEANHQLYATLLARATNALNLQFPFMETYLQGLHSERLQRVVLSNTVQVLTDQLSEAASDNVLLSSHLSDATTQIQVQSVCILSY